ncbi:LysR substrate-binding domain-containing protein [Terasakiella sp. A23]|uniref:LysR family transcriptional regulator n=1 Tax=Terasakiella sp. FCG-A23 TaxID=3080561 RepID=UPI002953C2A9|nr:LysR substrate-binding domain-containing protein [Terasakiella sp. A23]MDV7340484.1 LysR substrate-binding domain-containing protein [Terasakiella sp. A23]
MNMARGAFISKMGQSAPMVAALGKTGSFSKAAELLGVQQSAISHRVRLLEEALGFALFERTTRVVQLTDMGQILFEAATDQQQRWHQAYRALENFKTSETIRLSVSSSLAMKWVLPHLSKAREAGLDLALDINDEVVDFSSQQADVAIRFGRGPYPGLHSTFLKQAYLVPVASPAYGDDVFENAQTLYLQDHTGREDKTDFSWSYYKSHCGFDFQMTQPAVGFDRADLMLQAAINGVGVGLGRTLLIEQDMEQGFLKLVGPAILMDAAYWLVCSPGFAETARYKALLAWLKVLLKE